MNDRDKMSDFDNNDPVWDMLGRGRRREASPWFVDRVMNNLPGSPVGIGRRPWFARWVPSSVLALVFIAAWSLIQFPPNRSDFPLQTGIEFEIVRDLDLYISQLDSTVWTQ